jgi:hypothetical protein
VKSEFKYKIFSGILSYCRSKEQNFSRFHHYIFGNRFQYAWLAPSQGNMDLFPQCMGRMQAWFSPGKSPDLGLSPAPTGSTINQRLLNPEEVKSQYATNKSHSHD